MTLARRAGAELLGTCFLLATVVGSGIMGERLCGGNQAVALLANSIATGAGLVALILAFGPLSGAHLNPAVSVLMAARRALKPIDAGAYVGAQVLGAPLGVLLAHAMFELPLVSASQHVRAGAAQGLSEGVATFGLLLIVGLTSRRPDGIAAHAVGGYIAAAYWFTASTSFANPAVTLARALTSTFAGIRIVDVPLFVLAQVAGTAAALVCLRWLAPSPATHTESS